jgi:hypothetical protein
VVYELGFKYLFVDGNCNYWISATWAEQFGEQRPIRTGVLSASDEEVLSASVGYPNILELGAKCPGGTVVYNGEASIHCFSDAPVLADTQPLWQQTAKKLYQSGTPLSSAIRVELGKSYDVPSWTLQYDWPLSDPIEDYAVPADAWNETGISKLVADPEKKKALLELRAAYLATLQPLTYPDHGIRIVGGYVMYIREDLPFTDSTGLFTQSHEYGDSSQ